MKHNLLKALSIIIISASLHTVNYSDIKSIIVSAIFGIMGLLLLDIAYE